MGSFLGGVNIKPNGKHLLSAQHKTDTQLVHTVQGAKSRGALDPASSLGCWLCPLTFRVTLGKSLSLSERLEVGVVIQTGDNNEKPTPKGGLE